MIDRGGRVAPLRACDRHHVMGVLVPGIFRQGALQVAESGGDVARVLRDRRGIDPLVSGFWRRFLRLQLALASATVSRTWVACARS